MMNIYSACIYTVVFAFTQTLTAQKILYVSPAGNDTNAGTANAPFATIQHCLDQWDATAQYTCACSGVFSEELAIDQGGPSESLKNKLTAWDTDNDGDLSDETFTLDGQNTRNIALENKPGKKPRNIEISYVQFKNYFPDNGCGDDGDLHFIRLGCSGGSGCSDWWIHHCRFENLGYKTQTNRCNAGSHYIAIQPQNAPRLLVEDNRFTGIYGFVMRYINGANIRFMNNYVQVNTTGLKGWGENLDSMIISGNIFDCDGNGNPQDSAGSLCLGQNAINLSNNARFSLISNNVFYDCVQCITYGTSEDYGFRDNQGHVIENNIIYRTSKTCNKYNSPIKLEDCCSYSQNTGDSMELRDMVFRNNVINYYGNPVWWNQGAAIEIMAGHPFDFVSNLKFYNNSINGFRWGIRLDQCLINQKLQPFQLDGLDIRNNIFSNIRDGFMMLNYDGTWETIQPANVSSDYNTFYGKDHFGWKGNNTFSTWQSQLGFDSHSFFCKPLYSDTLSLKLDSLDQCARNKGIALGGFSNDIERHTRPQGDGWDIGADEYQEPHLTILPRSEAIQPVRIFPNPATSMLYIELENSGTHTLILYTMTGQVLKRETLANRLQYTLDISSLPQGSCLLWVRTASGKVYTQTIIRQ